MQQNDTRKLIVTLYVLTVLFLGAIYFQGEMIKEPGAIATLKNANYAGGGIIPSFQLSGEMAFLTLVSVTLFFGFAWLVSRARNY